MKFYLAFLLFPITNGNDYPMKRFFKLRRKILYSVALSIPLIGTAIVVHNLEKVPYTDRLRLMLLKEEKEIEFGELIQKEINKRFKPLPSGDPVSNHYLMLALFDGESNWSKNSFSLWKTKK